MDYLRILSVHLFFLSPIDVFVHFRIDLPCKMLFSQVKIKLLDSAPMQIDGEPWEQHPAEISLTHHAQVL